MTLALEISTSERRCGTCTLCCKLLPVADLAKRANQVCKFQRHAKGCIIHSKREYPVSCALWSCLWLSDDDAGELQRPDQSRYVIDPSPEYVEVEIQGRASLRVDVVQIWVDPKHPLAYRDPLLLEWIERRAVRLGHAALIRFDSHRAVTLFPPSLSRDGNWHERVGDSTTEHTARILLGDNDDQVR